MKGHIKRSVRAFEECNSSEMLNRFVSFPGEALEEDDYEEEEEEEDDGEEEDEDNDPDFNPAEAAKDGQPTECKPQ